ncbi:hypothetical protein DPV78_003766 [Talaromyces pinophilus]|nr:hypothetical protein DPV78_003766 [Talaromyces pinophilus]
MVARARACSGQFVANCVIYTALVCLLSSYCIVISKGFPLNTHYADYNAIKSVLVAIPRNFKVKLIPRNELELFSCLESGAKRTESHYVV